MSELPIPAPYFRAAATPMQPSATWRPWRDGLQSVSDATFSASRQGLPVFLGGDHSVSAGTVSGLARRAALAGRPLFVLWLDAHSDFHRLDTTETGNLHGVPLAYLAGETGSGFISRRSPPQLIPRAFACSASVAWIRRNAWVWCGPGVEAHAMADLRRNGLATALNAFLNRVRAAGGLLHVSLDADFLDPTAAPGVGTPEPGGASLGRGTDRHGHPERQRPRHQPGPSGGEPGAGRGRADSAGDGGAGGSAGRPRPGREGRIRAA